MKQVRESNKANVHMKQNVSYNRSGTKRLFDRLAAEKKKSVMALCLIALMTILWVRVLTRNSPQGAEAAPVANVPSLEDKSGGKSQIYYVELPKVAGRHDVIARDFFACNGWRDFVGGKGRNLASVEEVNIISRDVSEEVIRKVAEKLKLGAVMLSSTPLAFINDKVRKIGDEVLINDGVDKYECEVVEIRENTVVMKCREAEIKLKLMPVSTTDK